MNDPNHWHNLRIPGFPTSHQAPEPPPMATGTKPFETLAWSALAESVASYEEGVSPDMVSQMTLDVVYELVRRLGGFTMAFDLNTNAHLQGGSVLVPVPRGWTIAQVVQPEAVAVDGDLITFNSIGHHGNVIYHGYQPRQGEYIPPGGVPTDPYCAAMPRTDHIKVVVKLKPRLTEQCPDSLPLEIFESYHDALLYGVLAKVFSTGRHIDPQRSSKFRMEYGYALRQIRTEVQKKNNNRTTALNTHSFLDA